MEILRKGRPTRVVKRVYKNGQVSWAFSEVYTLTTKKGKPRKEEYTSRVLYTLEEAAAYLNRFTSEENNPLEVEFDNCTEDELYTLVNATYRAGTCRVWRRFDDDQLMLTTFDWWYGRHTQEVSLSDLRLAYHTWNDTCWQFFGLSKAEEAEIQRRVSFIPEQPLTATAVEE